MGYFMKAYLMFFKKRWRLLRNTNFKGKSKNE